MSHANNDRFFNLALEIAALRQQLAAKEAEWASMLPPVKTAPRPEKPSPRGSVRSRPGGPSISQRVLHLINDAGAAGLSRTDIVSVIGHPEAVHSALKQHSAKKRITHNQAGNWVRLADQRETRPMRAVQPPVDLQSENPAGSGRG